MRVLVLWCPDWPVLASGANVDDQVAVLEGAVVRACSASARAHGVRRGMTKREAQGVSPGLKLVDYDETMEAAFFEPVVRELADHGVTVAPLRPGLLATPIRQRWADHENAWAASLIKLCVDMGLWDVRAGVADEIFTAEQAARSAALQDVQCIPAGLSARFLARLPIDVVGPTELVDVFKQLGLWTAGDFAALPEGAVTKRFGAAGLLAHRRSRGIETQVLPTQHIAEDLQVNVTFDDGLEHGESVIFSIRRRVEEWIDAFMGQSLVCTAVSIETVSDDGAIGERLWRHGRWFSASDVLDRVRWQVSGKLSAPLHAITISPVALESWGDHATGLWGERHDAAISRVVARLQAIVGAQQVHTTSLTGGTALNDRVTRETWLSHDAPGEPAGPWPASMPPPAPATVFRVPRAAVVRASDGALIQVTERGIIRGVPEKFRAAEEEPWRTISAWAGPWPVDDHWWDEHRAHRAARFQVVGTDGTAWLMMVSGDQWFTEARYD